VKEQSSVSVLIPARNEERNIGHLLDDLADAGDEIREILVYDDASTDQTSGIIIEKARIDRRVRYLEGEDLPGGWSGKNHACHELARQARCRYLLFLDADVRITKDLLTDMLSTVDKHDLALLSLFPVQEMKSLSEWLVVPLMNRILVGNLPLFLVRKSKMPAFSAANGQCMLFDAETYKSNWFHQRFKDDKVEDIRIIRDMKKSGYAVQTLLSGGQIRCRMYSNFNEAMNGFAKNIHAFFGRNWMILFLYIFLTTLGPLAALLTFSLPGLILFASSLIFSVAVISFLSRQAVVVNLLLLPFQHISLVLLGLLAAYRHATGNITWKGRKV
jgi:chlorobactene glucosyltransferase